MGVKPIRRIIMLMFTSLLIIASNSQAKNLTFEKKYVYQASEADSKVSCRAIALEQVKRLLLEEVGTYLESQTEVKNYQLTRNQITMLTAGTVIAEIVKEEWDGKTYVLDAKVTVDPNEVVQSVNRIRDNAQLVVELKDAKHRTEDALKEIEILTKEIKNYEIQPEVKKKYNLAIKNLKAKDWYDKGYFHFFNKNYDEAIDNFNRAIELDSTRIMAWGLRGVAKFKKRKYQGAIGDITKLLENINTGDLESLESFNTLADFFSLRGLCYATLGQCTKARDDARQAKEIYGRNWQAHFALAEAFHCQRQQAVDEKDIPKYDVLSIFALYDAARLGSEEAKRYLAAIKAPQEEPQESREMHKQIDIWKEW
ncbi:MAG: tetratricopeptide repeat protein [Nitrospirota bacterium]